MQYIQSQLIEFKKLIEEAIVANGVKGKNSIIRTSRLINLVHDAVKEQLIRNGVNPELIYPKLNASSPELKISGFLKQKDQDICVIPKNIEKSPEIIHWGPLAYESKEDPYGYEFSKNTLIINVRSQLSSLAKNADTLFERTFAEALNLHMRYPEVVLGEVYLIPCYEYDDELAKTNTVGFKENPTNVEKYISFFSAINNRTIKNKNDRNEHEYERVSLLIVDFKKDIPKVYETTEELIKDNLVSKNFKLDYEKLNFKNFSKDILSIYADRHDLNNLK